MLSTHKKHTHQPLQASEQIWFCYSISPNSSMHCSSTNKFFAFYISFSFFKLCCFSPPWAPGISVGRRLVDTETTPIFTEERQKEANDAVDLHFDRSPPRSVASLSSMELWKPPSLVVANHLQQPNYLPQMGLIVGLVGIFCGFDEGIFFVGLMVKVGICWSLVNFCFEICNFGGEDWEKIIIINKNNN